VRLKKLNVIVEDLPISLNPMNCLYNPEIIFAIMEECIDWNAY